MKNSNSQSTEVEYLKTPKAAKFIGLSQRYLEKLRETNRGPKWRQLSKRVIIYSKTDLIAWVNSQPSSSDRVTGGGENMYITGGPEIIPGKPISITVGMGGSGTSARDCI